MKDIWTALWFFLPAVANAAPLFGNKIPGFNRWNTPLDLGYSWNGKRLLGDNKRFRGLVAGVALGIITIALQRYLYIHNTWAQNISYINYTGHWILLLGALIGLGALLGDAVESLFKRRLGIAAGHSWFPFDQIDYIIGGLLFSLPFVRLRISEYVWILIVWFGIHVIVSYIGYLTGFKDKPI